MTPSTPCPCCGRPAASECDHEYETKLHPGCGAGCDDAPMSAYSHYSDFCKKCGVEKAYPQHTHEEHPA